MRGLFDDRDAVPPVHVDPLAVFADRQCSGGRTGAAVRAPASGASGTVVATVDDRDDVVDVALIGFGFTAGPGRTVGDAAWLSTSGLQ